MANGKAIGNSEERKVAKYLTQWATGQSKDYVFWRCPSSGAIGTILEGNGDLCGDIIAIKSEGLFLTSKFSIEVKRNYPNSSFNSFMKKNKNDEIYSFWKQTCDGANKGNKYPMLFYTKTRHNTLIGIPSNLVNEINLMLNEKRRLTIGFEDGIFTPCTFFDMDDFFSIVKPENIKQLGEKND